MGADRDLPEEAVLSGSARRALSTTSGTLTGREWGRLAAMLLVIAAVNVAGWGIYVLCVMPHHFDYKGIGGDRGLGVGIGVAITAWFLGFRHAFDADHISAIDNTTRKLMADGKRPLGSGFFFSFGHSTVVVVVGVGITFATKVVFGAVVNPNSAYETAGGAAGTAVSAGFLYLIAALNLVVLAGIVRVFRRMRRGSFSEAELEAQLQSRGFMYRFFGRFMRSIDHTWQMFLVGLVFGIGFDTTTEVVLLAATAYAAVQGLPYYAVLALPFLFSGGMMLFDTLDGCFMNFAYGWAFAKPVRKVYYNLVITGLSIAAAFIIGTIELLGILTTRAHLHGAFWDAMANFNINIAGFCIAGLFVLVWTGALAYWRFGKVETRWTSDVAAEATGRGQMASSRIGPGVFTSRQVLGADLTSLNGAVPLDLLTTEQDRIAGATGTGGTASSGRRALPSRWSRTEHEVSHADRARTRSLQRSGPVKESRSPAGMVWKQ